MLSIDPWLQAGGEHYAAGRLAEAEHAYRQALALAPGNAFALHQLGALAMDAGQSGQAIAFLEQSVAADPLQAAYRANLGAAYYQAGRLERAEAALRAALDCDPQLTRAYAMLGMLLARLKRWEEAATCYRRVLEAEPNSADAQFDLAAALQSLGRVDEAANCYERAIALGGNVVAALANLSSIRREQKRHEEAIALVERALEIAPDYGPAWMKLGAAHEAVGRTDEAVAAYRRAIAADPTSAVAQSNLGAALQKQGHLDEALVCFHAASAADPRWLPAYLGFAAVFYEQGRLEDALAACRQALAIDPACGQAYLNMGRMLSEQGRREEAIEHCRRAIEIDPRLPGAHGNLAIALHSQGRVREAIEEHRREIAVNPDSAALHGNLLYALNFVDMPADEVFAEHRAWAARHADPLTAAAAPHSNVRDPDRRLRIGYVSPHFYSHAVNFFTEPILAHHDHGQFEVFCYSDVLRPDATTARLRGAADVWREIRGQGHEQVARRIREDRIDILIDLTGHIGDNRLPVFARKPAPIQVTYIGYQNTTGMRAMDCRLTDDYADPPGITDRYHTETLVRLPLSFFVYRPSADAPEVGPLPAASRGYVTFGSFNNFAKVTPEVLTTWAELLRSTATARLVILADMNPAMREYLRGTFQSAGVDPARLQLVHRLPRSEYLKLIASVDIALDPFPFNGHTTTCDCLWQGVPVVTLSGDRYVSRFGGSGIHTLGLAECIGATREEYLGKAVALASDLSHLAERRVTLRSKMAASPLLDFAGFTRNLEAEYRQMWRRYCLAKQ